ncbi:MAG: MerR family transcriptional regulator [Bacillota bacterium]
MDLGAAVLSIGVVSKMTGLSERQIRYYEAKGLIQPRRTSGGHRLYSEADVKLLKRIGELVGRGYRIEEVRQKLAREYGEPRTPLEGDAALRFGSKTQASRLYYCYRGEE